jgi:type IV pilus assembly protein PilP
LQRASIEQFKLVGVAAGYNHSKIAMVTDVKGKFYPIFVGTYIGLHNGRVVEILQDRVIVEETIKAEAKHAKTKRVAIKLRKEEGEVKP